MAHALIIAMKQIIILNIMGNVIMNVLMKQEQCIIMKIYAKI